MNFTLHKKSYSRKKAVRRDKECLTALDNMLQNQLYNMCFKISNKNISLDFRGFPDHLNITVDNIVIDDIITGVNLYLFPVAWKGEEEWIRK